MTITVYSYTIYHSPNAYLGTVLLRRAIAELPNVRLVRRPIYVPSRARADDRRNAGRQGEPERRLLSSRGLPALGRSLLDPVRLSQPRSLPAARRALGALCLRPRGIAVSRVLRGRY